MRDYNDGQPISHPQGTHERPNSGYTLPRSSSFLRQVKENWVILVFLVSFIVQWTNFNTRIASAESEIIELKQVVTSINEIKVDIAVIQNDVSYIKKNIP